MKILDIKLTYECNNNCILCCQDDCIKNSDGRMKTEYIIEILEENYKNYLCRGENIKLVLTGGEPTLHKDLKKIINVSKKLGYYPIQLQTNATVLSDKNLTRELIDLGVDSFGVSLHGHTKQIHELFTRKNGSYENTLLGLNELKRYNVNVFINTVISKLNIDYLLDIVEFIGKNNLSTQLQFAFLHITGRASNELDLIPSITSCANKIKECIDLGKQYNLNIKSEAIPPCLLTNYEKAISELHLSNDIIVYDNYSKMYFSNQRKNTLKRKNKNCLKCIFFNLCEGPWREYPEIFGWEEFIPVTEF